jgi:hypothetical protein
MYIAIRGTILALILGAGRRRFRDRQPALRLMVISRLLNKEK